MELIRHDLKTDDNILLLHTNMTAGHGGKSGRFERLREVAMEYAFIFDLIGIKEVTGGSINDSFLVSGVAFKKTFSYAGFEQQPKKFTNPKIIILKI